MSKQFRPYKTFDTTELRYLFVFNDVEEDLLIQEVDLGNGWKLKRVNYFDLDKWGVKHHFDEWLYHQYGKHKTILQAIKREKNK